VEGREGEGRKRNPTAGAAGDLDLHDKRGTGLSQKSEALLADEAPIAEMEELRPLIAEGQDKGVLSIERIASALEEVDVTKEQLGELHAYLEDQGIDIVGGTASPSRTRVPSSRRPPRRAASSSRSTSPGSRRST
jgi:RNA polymerase primary sigma factor